jgi:hypothetical protein
MPQHYIVPQRQRYPCHSGQQQSHTQYHSMTVSNARVPSAGNAAPHNTDHPQKPSTNLLQTRSNSFPPQHPTAHSWRRNMLCATAHSSTVVNATPVAPQCTGTHCCWCYCHLAMRQRQRHMTPQHLPPHKKQHSSGHVTARCCDVWHAQCMG